MTPSLDTILDRGRQYLAANEVAADPRLDTEFRQEVGLRTLRRHSDAMRDLSLDDAQPLLAAVIGSVKWHERQHADGRHLGDALLALEEAASCLRAHFQDEEAPSCQLPLVWAA